MEKTLVSYFTKESGLHVFIVMNDVKRRFDGVLVYQQDFFACFVPDKHDPQVGYWSGPNSFDEKIASDIVYYSNGSDFLKALLPEMFDQIYK